MNKIQKPSKEKLQELISHGASAADLSETFSASKSTIRAWCRDYEISLQKTFGHIFTKEFLETTHYSITELATRFECSVDVIWKYLKKYGVEYNKNPKAVGYLNDKLWLTTRYVDENTSLSSIANELSCGRETVKFYLNKHAISLKPRYKERVWSIDVHTDELASGLTSLEIAEKHGCSQEYIRQLQIRNDINRLTGWNQSSIERRITKLLDKHNIQYITNTKSIIHPYELDIFIAKANLAIEVNGIYYHTTKFVDKSYHEQKRKLCEDKGIRLIQLFEDDINSKFSIIENIVLNVLGLSENQRIYARKCELTWNVCLKTRTKFMNDFHIQGAANSTHNIGLLHDGELVALMLFNGSILTRYATKYNVVGGFSRLIKHSNMVYIKTYLDTSTFSGQVYHKNGFISTGYIKPDYKYVYKNKRIHKFNFRKSCFKNNKNFKFSENLTESELARLNGLERIYDSGKVIYEKWHNR